MSRRFLFWGFKSSRQIVEDGLGALELSVMAVAWSQDETTVRDACERLGQSVAYTTVMTTMDRLFKKGLLSRRKVGRAFVYQPTATRRELEGAVASEMVSALLHNHGEEPLPLLSSLVDAVSERDHDLLDDLERLIRAKRRALKAPDK